MCVWGMLWWTINNQCDFLLRIYASIWHKSGIVCNCHQLSTQRSVLYSHNNSVIQFFSKLRPIYKGCNIEITPKCYSGQKTQEAKMRVARAAHLVSSVLFTRLVTGNHRGIVILQVCMEVMFSVTSFPTVWTVLYLCNHLNYLSKLRKARLIMIGSYNLAACMFVCISSVSEPWVHILPLPEFRTVYP